MGRTRLNRVIAQLRKEIELCEKNKKKLLDYVNQIKNKCLDREINYFEYEQLINQKLDGKTIQEWLDSYDTHIKKREKKIKKEIRKFKANKILLIFSSLILISFIIFSAIYLRPIIVGLITQTPEESQPLSSETQEEAPQPSPSQDIKEPLPSETQPEQIEIPPSSEIPPAETPTTPIEENITQPETNITVPENITAPTNITVPEIPKNITLPEINLTNITIENITEQNITEANATIITTQYQAKIGQPVKWKKTIILEEPKTIKVKLPKQAENITVNKITEAQKEKKKSDSEITQEAPQQSPSQDIEEPLPSENPPANISETESINETQLSEINKTEELETSTEPISPPENNLNEQIEEPIKEKAKATITGGITGQAISEQETGKSIFQLIIDFFRKVFAGITGRAIITEEKAEEIEVTINDNATEYEILYETPAPQVYEEETEKGKRITISGPDELHYENVLAFTYLTKETPEQKVKLYWVRQENLSFINEETNKTITEKRETKEEINITKYDTNNNSLIDYIEWQVESLSNQTYDLIIEISKAEHLDENRSFISDIYEQVKALDGNWSEPINNNEYVRVTFNKNLTNKNDITIYARASNYSNNSEECYDNETEILTENGWKLFSELDKEKEKVATFNNKTEKLEWQLPYRYQEFEHNGEMYKIELEDGSKLVVSPEHKVYSKNNYLMPNISNNCLGGNTLTKDCSFSFLSPENIGQSSFNASAKYGESLKLILIASGNLSKNSEEGINSTCSLIKEIISDNSSLDNSVSSSILSNLFLISVNRNSGATNSNLFITLFASKTLKGLPFLINEENTTLTSITNNIVYPSFSSFSYLLANAKSVSSDNSSACSWVNLDLSTIDLIFDNLSNFSFNIFPIANCQFILNIEANSSNSSGMSIFACTINKNNTNDYLNFSIRNKGLSDFKLQKITDVYKNINENNKDVYFLDENNKPVKVKSITKQPYSGKIYDVDVENDIVLVRRKNDNKEINEPLSNLTSNSTAITSASFAALNNLNNNSFNNNYKNNENKEKDANDVASKAMQILADYNILNDNNYINISVETSHNSDILNNINNENKNENKEENNYSYLILTSGLDSNNDNIPEISSFVPEKASVVTAPDSVLRTTTATTFMTPSSVSLNPNLTVMTYFTIDNQNDLSYLNISVVNELNNNLTANNEDLIANENSDLDNSINIENNELINNFDNENNNSNKLINNFDKDSNISEQEASQYSPADDESKSSEKDEFGTAVWSGNSNPASIEVYRENDNISIAKFENITSENYYKIYLTNLSENESYDIFDLKVLGGSVEFDYIVDPTITESQVITQSNLVNVTAETGKSNFTHLTINNLSTNAPYDSLVGYWNFDGDLENTALTTHYDFSRYNNDGTGVGDVTVNTTNCIYDDCARFDGAEDFIDNNNVNLANKNYTVMAWINMKNNLAWNGILSNPTWGRFIFKINDSAVFLYHRSPNTGGVIGTSTFNNNQWYHIVGVFNNKTGMEAYSNGVSIGSVSTASSSGNLAGVHVIGVSNNTLSGGSVYFNGTLDEIMVFNISLTSAQILAIYNNQSARFYSTGTQDVPNINISTLGTENRVNITLYDCDALFNSNLSGQIGIADGSGAYNYNGSIVNFSSCIANNLTIEGNPNNVSLRITFLAGNSTNPFYSPLVIGNITLDSWYEAPAGGDTIYPDFSEYYDDNASLLDTGTGHFNVTVKNTNGTVWLEINNTNITATNLTTNVYNASYNFTSAGTYTYRWHSWGNGTSNNYNVSNTQSYTVNASNITYEIVGLATYQDNITDYSVNGIFSLAVSSDGNYLFTSSYDDDYVSIMNISNKSAIVPLATYTDSDGAYSIDSIPSIAVSSDGNYLFTSSADDDYVSIMNISNKSAIVPLATYTDSDGAYSIDSIYSLAVSSDGNYLFISSVSDDYVSIMNISNKSAIVPLATYTDSDGAYSIDSIPSIAVSSDGNYLFTSSYIDNYVSIMNISNKSAIVPLATYTDSDGAYSIDSILSIAVSSDGNYLFTSSYDDDYVSIMNISNKSAIVPLATYNNSDGDYSIDGVYSIAVSSDGNYLFTSSADDDYVSIMNISNKSAIVPLATYNNSDGAYSIDSILSIAVSSDGNYLFTSSADDDYVSIMFLNITEAGDTIYPDFSDYWDDNATLKDTGTGHFNVTVKNTNGTVILHINNTDIYATNLSADYYNVSYAFSSAGTYQYNWTAYGNGTSHNLNTSAERYYTVNLSQAPQITFVFNNSITDLSESGPNEAPASTSVIINFSAYSVAGASNLNHSSASVNFTKTNENTRQNTTCSMYASSENYANYTCNVTMWWWDGAGTWNIGVSIKDNQNNLAANTSTTFTLGSRTSFVASPAVLTWPGIAPGATNQTSNNDPLLLNNTGNDIIDATGITVNSSNLRGETTSSQALWASNFSVDWKTGGSCTGANCVECADTIMVRNAYTAITTANLTKGNYTDNNKNGQEELYVCLRLIGAELSTQAYSTANQTEWPWVVRILLVVLTIKKTNKLKKKKKSGQKNIGELSIPSTIFSNKLGALEAITKYMKENLGMSYHKIAEILNRDDRTIWTAYNKAKEKQRELIIVKETNIFLPVSIFNKRLTTLEAMIIYLKEQGLRYNEIAKLLDRDQRNIWAIYSKAIRKRKEKKKVKDKNITNINIPSTIFSNKLGALEAITKYMKENLGMSYHKIAEILNRDDRTIWTAYNKAKEKQRELIIVKETNIFLPVSIFNKKLTILEAMIIYLKEQGLRYTEIAKLLDRDQRNIWTIYSKAVKK